MKNKTKKNNILIEKYEDLNEYLVFEQDYWSRTATGVYKIAHNTIRLMKWLACYDRSYYVNFNYYDLMGSIPKYLNEIS